jgi:hypothetical protein
MSDLLEQRLHVPPASAFNLSSIEKLDSLPVFDLCRGIASLVAAQKVKASVVAAGFSRPSSTTQQADIRNQSQSASDWLERQ